MIGSVISHHTVLQKLGAGGMGSSTVIEAAAQDLSPSKTNALHYVRHRTTL